MATAPTVLVADDHGDSRLVLRTILEHRGSRVLEVEDGVACLEVARGERPDVIVLDLFLPLLDGWHAAQMLGDDPRTTSIPILAFTASTIAEDHQRALAAGCKLVLVKPSTPRNVADVVAALHAWHVSYLTDSAALLEQAATLREQARIARSESEELRVQAQALRAESAALRALVSGKADAVWRLDGVDPPAPPIP